MWIPRFLGVEFVDQYHVFVYVVCLECHQVSGVGNMIIDGYASLVVAIALQVPILYTPLLAEACALCEKECILLTNFYFPWSLLVWIVLFSFILFNDYPILMGK
ncbi:hypothetical protein Csa_012899 [Cucumis sativus]|uniref:Uncharacterized protein n=1 Tax=Cucumis sativus TaxID=3659 RepID=A0A0A0KYC1_CUCSA|nr:hypothetical protein Csa_012899 [Cucumis sativus]